MGKQWKQWQTLFSWAPKSLQMVTIAMKLKMLAPWKKSYRQTRQHIKKQRHCFADKGLSSQSYGLSSGHVWMRELDYKENRAPKTWCFWTVVLDKTLANPLDCKEIQPVHPKGNQFNSVQFSCSVVSDSLRPHESKHARPPYPSPTPGVHPDSRPSSQWCHPGISSSVVPFSSCLQSSQHQSLFRWVSPSHEVAKVLEFQL